MPNISILEQAIQLHQSGNLSAALDAYQKAVDAEPRNPYAWDGLGLVLRTIGDLKGALKAGTTATICGPDEAQVWSNLGNTLAALGDDAAALEHYVRATTLAPDYADAWANRGMSEKRLGRVTDATTSLSHAAGLMTNNPSALNNIGNLLFELSKFKKAHDCYASAVEADPTFANAWNNLGNTHLQLLHPERAQTAYEQALANDTLHPEARNGYSQALLMAGDFERGWAAYEARFHAANDAKAPAHQAPKWTGEPLTGKSIVILAEQGLGDTIQFVRFARHLKSAGAQVILECPKNLADLASMVFGIDQTVSSSDQITADFCLPLMSLPHVLRLTQVEDFTMEGAYVNLGPLPPQGLDTPQIGLVWSGNPDHVNDHNRSIKLAAMTPLLELPQFDFHSFQQGSLSPQAADQPEPGRLKHTDRRFETFTETAKALADMDLLITVDTSIAHLAGAMGCPCWLLLPFVPDWRWMLGTDATPWYPSMRLFRQSSRGDWSSVMREVAQDLQRHF